jgi:hypothetical protein
MQILSGRGYVSVSVHVQDLPRQRPIDRVPECPPSFVFRSAAVDKARAVFDCQPYVMRGAYALQPDMSLWKEGHVMTWTSDSAWVLIYSVLVTLLMLAWAYVPA